MTTKAANSRTRRVPIKAPANAGRAVADVVAAVAGVADRKMVSPDRSPMSSSPVPAPEAAGAVADFDGALLSLPLSFAEYAPEDRPLFEPAVIRPAGDGVRRRRGARRRPRGPRGGGRPCARR